VDNGPAIIAEVVFIGHFKQISGSNLQPSKEIEAIGNK